MAIPITRVEYEKKFGVKPNIQQSSVTKQTSIPKPKVPILTNEQGGFGTAVKDVAVGAGKSFIQGARGTAQLLQGAGKLGLGALGADTSKLGVKSLEDEGVDKMLSAKSRGEQVGKVLGTVAELGTGFVKSSAQQALKARSLAKEAQKSEKFVIDLISPKATSQVAETALQQGRVTEPGFLRRAKILPSKAETEIADAVKDFVSPKKTVLQNTDAIDKGIRNINNGVKEYVATNKVPFNMNQLKSKLNQGKEELRLIFASDTNAEKTYNAVVDEFMKHVPSGDTEGLLAARQTVDKIPSIKKLLDSQGMAENVKKEVVLTVREMANRFIAELLPEGNIYRSSLLKESKMIRAIENIAEKNRGMIGKNNLQILAQRYPILKWVIGGVATGIAGGAGVGVGSAIIGSTD